MKTAPAVSPSDDCIEGHVPGEAHEYYGEGRDRQIGGMSFPDDQAPDYWDFAYFAFTIGMCAQVSDVTVSSKTIRRTVLTHSIISFLFNAALLALTVNIAASAI